ncbi:MAG: SpoIIE family protein phosphatase [Saccharofermentans sp.]|nr:SpoIIE family protein phosphatase [Saccharofermentans sp.]
MKIRNCLGLKLLIGIVIMQIVFAAGISYIVAFMLRRSNMQRYEDIGISVTSALASAVDLNGDKVSSYIENISDDEDIRDRVDAYYEEIQEGLNRYRKEFGVTSIYIAKPEENEDGAGGIVYIWDASDEIDYYNIGRWSPCSPGGFQWSMERMNGEAEHGLHTFDDEVYGEVATAASPIYNSDGDAVALVYANFSIEVINETVRNAIVMIIIAIATVTGISSVILYFYIKGNVVTPLKRLTSATSDLTNNLDSDQIYISNIHTGDEIEELSRSFEKMDAELRDYIRQNMQITADKQKISTELQMAASIQEDQLPRNFPAFPDKKEFDIYASMDPAKAVGGDFYDFFLVDDDHLALVMADVSGKGVPAALFMMISKILIKNRIQAGDSPAQALDRVNKQLLVNNDTKHFVTVWLAVIEISTGKGVAANAGHEHPVIKRADGKYELVVYRHSPPLASIDIAVFKQHEFELHPGDSLFVYTDGLPEANNRSGEFFGTDRMLDVLNSHISNDPKEVLENMTSKVNEFIEGADQFDDLTMLNIQYYGPDGKKNNK